MTAREKPSTGAAIIVVALIAGMLALSVLEIIEGTCR